MNSPTALNKRGKKIHKYGEDLDSQKELDFYERFIMNKWPRELVKVHLKFELVKGRDIGRARIYGVSYTPDIVILAPDGSFKHVYDVKNSFTPYGIDTANKLYFRLFAMKYRIPVEAVVIRAHNFKSVAIGVTKQLRTTKDGKAPNPIVRTDPDYDWIEATNY